ncbi:efflux RND transporter periplasmic adaptor subunit [bacterium]|nr:efflux RND transporter periplasmic adaptor subunit [bacterium]
MRKRILLVVGIVVVVAVVASVLVVRQRNAKRTKTAAPQLVKVERGSVRRTVTADGTLKALTSVDVKSDAGGKVILLAVDVGDKVKKGDLIAKIDPTNTETAYSQAVADMQSSQAQLSQAQAEAQAQPRLTRSTIAQAQAAYDSAVADLKRLQSSTQPRDRADARASLDRAQASVREAQENLSRMNVSTHPVSRSSARASLDQAQASLRSAQETVKRLKQAQHPQASVQAKASLDKAKSALSVAEKELKRSRELNAKGYLSQSSLETAEDTCESARAAYAEAQEVVRTVADDQAAELRAAEADVDQAQATLAAAQKKWTSLDDDQGSEKRATEAQLQQAQADLASAQRQWATLDQDQAEELAASRQAVKKARAALDNAKADAMQVRVKAEAVVSQRAQLAKAAAEVNDTRTTLSYTTITAPRDGVILSKDVEEGTIVNSGRSGVSEGTSIVTLGDLSAMYVDVDVDETDLADISVGQQVEIEVDSVANKVLKGKVTRVDPQASTTSNVTTVPVEIEVLDHDKRLLPGLSATCTFLVGERTNVLTLPTRAIRQRDGKTTVTIPGDPSARVVMVEVGLEGDETTEIVSGLNEGDQVILPQLGANTGSDMGGPPPGMGGGFLKSSSK